MGMIERSGTQQSFVDHAFSVIGPGHTVVLDESAPSLALASVLASMPGLSVVTTGLDTAMILHRSAASVVLVAGQLDRASRSVITGSPLSIPPLTGAVTGFFGASSYSSGVGLLEQNPALAHTKSLLSGVCTVRYGVLSANRVGHFAPYPSVPDDLLAILYLTQPARQHLTDIRH